MSEQSEKSNQRGKLKPDSDFDFGKQITELEQIAEYLQGSEVSLDTAIKKYERGVEIAAKLKMYLKQAENKVETIKQSFDK